MSINMASSREDDPIIKPSLRERYKEEYKRTRAAGSTQPTVDTLELQSSTDDEYKAECAVIPKEFLNRNPDPKKKDDLLPELENLPRFLEQEFENGDTICLAILPFDDVFFGKESKEIDGSWGKFLASKQFLRALLKQKSDGLTRGVAGTEGYFYELLCDRLKKDVDHGGCSFEIHYPKPAGSIENKTWFLEQYSKALTNLRAFFNEPMGADKTLN